MELELELELELATAADRYAGDSFFFVSQKNPLVLVKTQN
jgi:hypothetical protein